MRSILIAAPSRCLLSSLWELLQLTLNIVQIGTISVAHAEVRVGDGGHRPVSQACLFLIKHGTDAASACLCYDRRKKPRQHKAHSVHETA